MSTPISDYKIGDVFIQKRDHHTIFTHHQIVIIKANFDGWGWQFEMSDGDICLKYDLDKLKKL